MRRRLQVVFISACIGALFSSVALGQGIGDRNRAADSGGGSYAIKGRVYLPNGRPAQNARVDIINPDAPPLLFYTNMDGIFQTGNVRAGNFTIAATVRGLPTERETLIIDRDTPAGRTVTVTLYLRNPAQRMGGSSTNNRNSKDARISALDHFKKGMEKLEKNEAKEAIVEFDAAIAAHPSLAVAYHGKGLAHLKVNELDDALAAFVKAIELKPDYTEAKYSVGYVHYLKKNYEVAAAVFDDVVKIKADLAEAEMYRGISLYYLKNVDAAEVSLKKTVAMPAGDKLPIAHLYLGQIYITKKKNAEAAAELEKYLELVPEAPNAEKLKTTIADLKQKT